MIGTLTLIISVSTAFFAGILWYFGGLSGLSGLLTLIIFVAIFNIVQWLLAPYLINALYRVKDVKPEDSPRLHEMVSRLAVRSGIKKPRLGIANVPIPNAFAYGSPVAGSRVAVTQGLLDTLAEEEVEAVLGHEFGHLKHRDVQIMMMVSFLPSLFYILGRWAMLSAYYGGGRDRREGGGGALLIGMVSIFVYFILQVFILGLSRLREYYADSHSASIVEEGPRKLSEGLAKIVTRTGRMYTSRQQGAFALNGFKSLFISDPDRAREDSAQIAQYAPALSDREMVERLLSRRVTSGERFLEILSTHPNITKRLKALLALEA